MFPTASSTIYRNEDGEVLGWDNDYGYEPDYDPYEDHYYADEEPDYYGDADACRAAGTHGNDCSGNGDGTWECDWCGEDCTSEMDARTQQDDREFSDEGGEDRHLDGYWEERLTTLYE